MEFIRCDNRVSRGSSRSNGSLDSILHVVEITNPEKYGIDWKAFLVIRNASKDDEMEYRCTVWKVRNGDPESSFVILSIRNETGKRLFRRI